MKTQDTGIKYVDVLSYMKNTGKVLDWDFVENNPDKIYKLFNAALRQGIENTMDATCASIMVFGRLLENILKQKGNKPFGWFLDNVINEWGPDETILIPTYESEKLKMATEFFELDLFKGKDMNLKMLTIKDDDTNVVTGKIKTGENKMTVKTEMFDVLKSGVVDGLKQGATDEVGEVLLDVFKSVAGDNALLSTEKGREIAKIISGYGILFALSSFGLSQDNKEIVASCVKLQTQTGTMRLLQPHMGKLHSVIQTLLAKGVGALSSK